MKKKRSLIIDTKALKKIKTKFWSRQLSNEEKSKSMEQ